MSNGIFSVVEHGAVADGKTVNTKAIQAAVDACAAAGGGRVVVPAGVFLSGAIFMKSRVELHLEAGAVLRGVQDLEAFPLIRIQAQGFDIRHLTASLITAIGEKDVAVTGCGTLDGQGAAWWKAQGAKQRPPLIQFNDCERGLLRDIRVTNSPFWTIRMMLSRDLTVDRVKVENPWQHYHNNDGINVVSCRDVRVTNCQVDTGDDGITLKSIPGADLDTPMAVDFARPRVPCENIMVSNCVVRHAHGGVVFGSETVGGVRDVVVTNCVFEGTRQGIFVKGSPYGGYVKNVRVSGVIMKRVENGICLTAISKAARNAGIFIAMNEYSDAPDARVEDLHFSNISMSQCSMAVQVAGLPDAWVKNVSFRNISADADVGIVLRRAENVVLDDLSLSCRGIGLDAQEVKGLEVRKLINLNAVAGVPVLQFEKVRDAFVQGCTAARGSEVFAGLVGEDNDIELSANRTFGAAERAAVEPVSSWNTCSHAFTGCRWIRDVGTRNPWLPVSEAVDRFVRSRWTKEQVDGVWSVSRVEANARDGAEVEGCNEARRIYIIESRIVDERLVVFEDGELLRTVSDPDLHAHFEVRQKDFELARIDARNAAVLK